MLKLIGLSLILTASSAMGLGLARTVRRQQAQTLAFIDAVLRIRHELQYRLTPLPEIFAALGGSRNREIAEFFSRLAALLSSAQTCTVGYACRQALAQTLDGSIRAMAAAFELWDFGDYGPVIESTVYEGLYAVGAAVLNGTFRKGRRRKQRKAGA